MAKTKKAKISSKTSKKTNLKGLAGSFGASNKDKRFKLLTGALILVILGMVGLKFKYVFVPAVVNGKPIFAWSYVKSLHKSAGSQVMNQLVTERLINQEAERMNVVISDSEIDEELVKIEAQFADSGGIDAFLEAQGLTKEEIKRQIGLNLKVEKLLSDKVVVSDEEVDNYYDENVELFEEVSKEEASLQIKENLAGQKLQKEAGLWLEELRKKAKIGVYLPGAKLLKKE